MTAEPTFFDIRNRILAWGKLSIQAKTIWISLCQYSWADGSCYVSRNTLAEKHGMSLPAVKRARKELTDKQLISVFKRPIPQTAVIFPFIQFEHTNQRCSNVVNLSNSIGSKMTLLTNNNINDLETDGVKSEPIMGSKMTLSMGSNSSPIKEKYLKENIKEEVHTSYVCDERSSEPERITATDPVETAPATKTKAQLRREKAESRQQQREDQLTEIRAELDLSQSQHPDFDVHDLFQRLDFWLHNDPTGKTRLNIHRTWKWWLNKEQSKTAMRKKFPANKPKREFDEEEYKRYVAEFTK